MNGTETIRLKTKNRRLFERIIAILLIFVAPNLMGNKLVSLISNNKEMVKELAEAAKSTNQ